MYTTLEEYLEDQCGMVTPKLLEKFEPHREFIEHSLDMFDPQRLIKWSDFTRDLWMYLPEITQDDFKP